jgi:hypothetical protein
MRNLLRALLTTVLVTAALPAVAHEAAGQSAATSFTVRNQQRVLDTRDGIGTRPGTVPAGGTVTLDLSAYLFPDTTSVVMNVTAVAPSQATFVAVWPAGQPRPSTSNLNVAAGEIRSNQVTVPVSADLRVHLYNHAGTTHLVADLAGVYAPGADTWFNTVSPQRVLDTRTTGEPFFAFTGRTIDVSGLVPPDAESVVLNVTAVRPEQDTFLTVFPDIFHEPATSSVNAMRGAVTPNLVTVQLMRNAETFAVTNHAGTTDVIIDLVGYYSAEEGAAFHHITPARAYDSRTTRPVPPATPRRVPLDTVLPGEATAVLFNLTGIATRETFLAAYPAGTPRPVASTLNLAAGQTASNQAATNLGAQRGIDVYNHAGDTHVVVDVFGYFAPRP